jgi:CBS domain-containing protein
LVVLGPDKRPVGILTDRDLVTRVIAGCKDPFTETVDNVMTKHVHVVSEDTSIEDVLSLMRSAEVRRLPVVDHESRLVGIVTLDDILLLLCEEIASIREVLTSQTPVAAAREPVARRAARA